MLSPGPGILLYNRHTGAPARALDASPGPAEVQQEASAALAAAQAALAALDADVARYSQHFGAGCCDGPCWPVGCLQCIFAAPHACCRGLLINNRSVRAASTRRGTNVRVCSCRVLYYIPLCDTARFTSLSMLFTRFHL